MKMAKNQLAGGSLPRISAETFKKGLEVTPAGVLYPHAGIVKSNPAIVEKAPKEFDGERVQLWTISTSAVDRDDDTINVKGWKLKDFNKGGSVLWSHGGDFNVGTVPIAKPLKTYVEDDKLKSIAEFTPRDMNPFGFMIYEMSDQGFVRGSSVGFKPGKFEPNEEREGFMPLDFTSGHQLLEWSVTPVPSNPEALLEARSVGIDLLPLKSWIEAIKDRELYCPPNISDQELEAAYKCVSEHKPTVYVAVAKPGETVTTEKESEDPEPKESLTMILQKETEAIQVLEAKANEVVEGSADDFLKTLSEIVEVQKRGRVLSSANEGKLRKAKEMIEAVLDALGAPEDDDKGKSVSQPEPQFEAAADEDEGKEEEKALQILAEMLAEHIKNTNQEIDAILGRIE